MKALNIILLMLCVSVPVYFLSPPGGEPVADANAEKSAVAKREVSLDPRWVRSKHDFEPSSPRAGHLAMARGKDSQISGGGEVVLKRQSNGHYYADVRVDGGEVRFMVDTGASVIALTGDDAHALGFEWRDDELQNVGRGASGAVFGKQVMLQSVNLGNFTVRNVPAVILPNGLDVSLLGQSFLSKIPNVNIRSGEMVLS